MKFFHWIVEEVKSLAIATLLALLLERAFEARAENGGFLNAFVTLFEHRETSRVWATTICVGLAFAAYNAFGVLFNALGPQEVRRIFFRRTSQPA